jgi:hypothetical protein
VYPINELLKELAAIVHLPILSISKSKEFFPEIRPIYSGLSYPNEKDLSIEFEKTCSTFKFCGGSLFDIKELTPSHPTPTKVVKITKIVKRIVFHLNQFFLIKKPHLNISNSILQYGFVTVN